MNKAKQATWQEEAPPEQRPFAYHLSNHVESRIKQVLPTAASNAQVDRCLSVLREMMAWLWEQHRVGPEWEVEAFGSIANGLGTMSSDLDVTCFFRDHRTAAVTPGQAKHDLANCILPMLKAHPDFKVVEEILGARVPILKLRFEASLDVDLSCHNPKPLKNTRLLKAYSRLDSRIQALGLAVKLWAKGSGICDASRSNLSSYAFTLLMVYFLQVFPDIKLPRLPVDAFEEDGKQEEDERVVAAMAGWKCSLTLSELLARFFAFYSDMEVDGFFWGSEVASIRCGCRQSVQDMVFEELRGRHSWRIHIEDPYQVERNLHVVLGDLEEAQLRAAFGEAWRTIQSKQVPKALQSFVPLNGDPGVPPPPPPPPLSPPEAHKTVYEPLRMSTTESWLSTNSEDDRLSNLVQVYKDSLPDAQALSETANSTKSGGTSQTISDDESCEERCTVDA